MPHDAIEMAPPAIGELAADKLQIQQKGLPRGRPFLPGQSGNPAGRAPGSQNRATLFAQALLDGDTESLMQQAIGLALKGDRVALKLCIDRILPRRRDEPVKFDLPLLNTAEDGIKAIAAIIAATAEGELTPIEARQLCKLVESFLRSLDISGLRRPDQPSATSSYGL